MLFLGIERSRSYIRGSWLLREKGVNPITGFARCTRAKVAMEIEMK